MAGLRMTAKPPMVVVIDENPAARSLYQRSCMWLDLELKAFSSPEESLVFLANHAVDLVFLDIIMRDMDGFLWLRKLRDMQRHQYTAVVIVTSKDYAQDRGLAEQFGSREYWIKPLRSQEIRQIISRHLSRHSSESC